MTPDELAAQLAADVRSGLTAEPKVLLPKYFYDAHGSELFDEITRLPEYYPTRAERAVLEAEADAIAAATGARTLVELGSGTSEKTRLLLDALVRAGTLERFVPFDVDPAVLGEASRAIAAELPGVAVEPVVGDFEKHLGELPRHPRRLLAFLGSTIGNLLPEQRADFLAGVRATLGEMHRRMIEVAEGLAPEEAVAVLDFLEHMREAVDSVSEVDAHTAEADARVSPISSARSVS